MICQPSLYFAWLFGGIHLKIGTPSVKILDQAGWSSKHLSNFWVCFRFAIWVCRRDFCLGCMNIILLYCLPELFSVWCLEWVPVEWFISSKVKINWDCLGVLGFWLCIRVLSTVCFCIRIMKITKVLCGRRLRVGVYGVMLAFVYVFAMFLDLLAQGGTEKRYLSLVWPGNVE